MINFKNYWSNKSSSMGRSYEPIYYQKKAEEHSRILSRGNLSKGLVDFGCGAGELLKELAPLLDKPIIAVDFSLALLKTAKENNANNQVQFELSEAQTYFPPEDFGSVWMTCSAVNQYSSLSELNHFLSKFDKSEAVQEIYLFDCIHPVQYQLFKAQFIGSYLRPVRFHPRQFISMLKTFLLVIYTLKRNVECLSLDEMGFGYSFNYWHKLKHKYPDWTIEIVSSMMFEYRYHVIIKKREL